MEAFCWTDLKAICIDCLLTSQSHKNHEILNLEKSIEKQEQSIKVLGENLNLTYSRLKKIQDSFTNAKNDLAKTELD